MEKGFRWESILRGRKKLISFFFQGRGPMQAEGRGKKKMVVDGGGSAQQCSHGGFLLKTSHLGKDP